MAVAFLACTCARKVWQSHRFSSLLRFAPPSRYRYTHAGLLLAPLHYAPHTPCGCRLIAATPPPAHCQKKISTSFLRGFFLPASLGVYILSEWLRLFANLVRSASGAHFFFRYNASKRIFFS